MTVDLHRDYRSTSSQGSTFLSTFVENIVLAIGVFRDILNITLSLLSDEVLLVELWARLNNRSPPFRVTHVDVLELKSTAVSHEETSKSKVDSCAQTDPPEEDTPAAKDGKTDEDTELNQTKATASEPWEDMSSNFCAALVANDVERVKRSV